MPQQLTVNLLPVEWELRVFSPENNIGKPWEWACHVKADPLGNKWLVLANGWPSAEQVRAISVELSRLGWGEVFAVRYEFGIRHVYAINQDGRAMEVEFSINEVSRRRDVPGVVPVSSFQGDSVMQKTAAQQSHVTTVAFNGKSVPISHSGGVDSMSRVTGIVGKHVGNAHGRIPKGMAVIDPSAPGAVQLPVTWSTTTTGISKPHDVGQHMLTFANQQAVTEFEAQLAQVHAGIKTDLGAGE